jgi:hypothetical protein
MRCPDINRFLDALDPGGLPPDLATHLESCAACRSRLRVLDELTVALRPDTVASQRMLLRAMEGVRAARRAERARIPTAPLLASSALAFVSALAVLLLTGAGEEAGAAGRLLLALAVGAGTGIYLRWWVWPGEAPDD